VAAALREIGLRIEVHHDHFGDGSVEEISDEFWIREVTRRGWVIVTRDGRIRRNPLERLAFVEAGARVFNVVNGSATALQVAEAFRKARPAIERILANQRGPFIAGLSLNGKVTFLDSPP
jgi:hypothetical protein